MCTKLSKVWDKCWTNLFGTDEIYRMLTVWWVRHELYMNTLALNRYSICRGIGNRRPTVIASIGGRFLWNHRYTFIWYAGKALVNITHGVYPVTYVNGGVLLCLIMVISTIPGNFPGIAPPPPPPPCANVSKDIVPEESDQNWYETTRKCNTMLHTNYSVSADKVYPRLGKCA